MSKKKTPITFARGDGIGPEIMDATLHILNEAGAQLDLEEIQIGEAIYKAGVAGGMIQCIEDTAIPGCMIGLLYALPNTQLTRRLFKEGRSAAADQLLALGIAVPAASAAGTAVPSAAISGL